jgi:hypothetical protein
MAPPDLAQRGETVNPWRRHRQYTTLAVIFSLEGVNITSGEEETGRLSQGVEEEKLSGLALAAPALAAPALAALVLATAVLAAPMMAVLMLVAPALAAPAVCEMVAPVLTGPSVWKENENPAGSAGGYRPAVNHGDTSSIRLCAAPDVSCLTPLSQVWGGGVGGHVAATSST